MEPQNSTDLTLFSCPSHMSKNNQSHMETKLSPTIQSKYYICKDRPPSKKNLKVNTSRSRGELRLLKEIIAKNKWTQVFKEGDVMWSGLGMYEEDIFVAADILLNRLPETKHLCHKKTMGYILNKFVEFWPEEYWFYPKTYLIPEETEELDKKIKTSGGLYIAKPSAGSQGDGIALISRVKDIPHTIFSQDYVVQPYIDKPLLQDGKKFDLRLYILVSSIEPYICFLNEEGLVRLCAQDYQPPTKDNIKNPYIHLTNYSLNKNHEKYLTTDTPFGKGNKRCFKVLWEQLEEEGVDVDTLRERIEEVCKKFMVGLYPFLKYYYKSSFPKGEGKCFQIIGLDILIDEHLTPWILEANSNPSLNIEHEVYKFTGQTSTEISQIDRYVKRMVIEDAIYLAKKPLSSLKSISEQSTYYSYKNIINCNNSSMTQMNIFSNMLKVFHHLTGIRSKRVITSSQFVKLARFQGMTGDKLTRNDYHLVFVKVMRWKGNPGQMDFEAMIEALEYVVGQVKGYTKETKLEVMSEQVESLVNQIES